jgi:hypothetical protein
VNLHEPPKVVAQQAVAHQTPRTPRRYQQWAKEKYIKLLESQEMLQAFHGGGALEITSAQRLIFPNTSSMNLSRIPGTDRSGYSEFSDEINDHYLATFGIKALMSFISATQMVGLMAAFGGSGTYGLNGSYQANQWAKAGEMAGSSAFDQFGGLGQQMIGNGLDRPSTIEIRPGYHQRDGNPVPRVPGSLRQIGINIPNEGEGYGGTKRQAGKRTDRAQGTGRSQTRNRLSARAVGGGGIRSRQDNRGEDDGGCTNRSRPNSGRCLLQTAGSTAP